MPGASPTSTFGPIACAPGGGGLSVVAKIRSTLTPWPSTGAGVTSTTSRRHDRPSASTPVISLRIGPLRSSAVLHGHEQDVLAFVVVDHVRVLVAQVRERHFDDVVFGVAAQCRAARTLQDVLVLRFVGRVAHAPTASSNATTSAGPSGCERISTPSGASASAIALITHGGAPMAPPSPRPLWPPGFVGAGVSMCAYSISGTSVAVGNK